MRAQIEGPAVRLAAIETSDVRGRQAIKDAFVAGYRMVFGTGDGIAIASSLSAAVLISDRNIDDNRQIEAERPVELIHFKHS